MTLTGSWCKARRLGVAPTNERTSHVLAKHTAVLLRSEVLVEALREAAFALVLADPHDSPFGAMPTLFTGLEEEVQSVIERHVKGPSVERQALDRRMNATACLWDVQQPTRPTKDRDRYKVAKWIQAEPVFCGFGRSAHSKVISVSVLTLPKFILGGRSSSVKAHGVWPRAPARRSATGRTPPVRRPPCRPCAPPSPQHAAKGSPPWRGACAGRFLTVRGQEPQEGSEVGYHMLNPHYSVRRDKAPFLSGCESRPATVAPAGSSRSGRWR